MDRKVLVAAVAALAAPFGGPQIQLLKRQEEAAVQLRESGYGRLGKGKGRRPHHSSSRFVAQDKRDARKRRNRRG